VGSVRLDAPANEPFGEVARVVSTKVDMRVPTAYDRPMSMADRAALGAGVSAGAGAWVTGGGVVVVVDVGVEDVDGDADVAEWWSSLPPRSAMPATVESTTKATTAAPITTAVRRRRRATLRREARGEVMPRHGSQARRSSRRGGTDRV
jgi:hypothetical protein